MPPSLAPELTCGFALVDDEHAQVLRSLTAVCDAAREQALPAVLRELRTLTDQLQAHFAHEEQLMAEAQYPERGRHKAAHDLFMQDFAEQSEALATEGLSAAVQQWLTIRLPEWVRFHIQMNDQPLGRYLAHRTAQSTGGHAVRSRQPVGS